MQRNSSGETADRMSPVSEICLSTGGPGANRLADRRASFRRTRSSALNMNVGAIALNSIVVVPGWLRISGPRRRYAVKLSTDDVAVVKSASETTIMTGTTVSSLREKYSSGEGVATA